MSIKMYDKSGSTPQEVLLAGISPVDQILNGTSKNAISNKAVYNALAEKIEVTVENLTNFYNKSQTYNKTEVRALVDAISTLTIEVVNSLPTQDISTTTIYFLKQSGTNVYDQYVYVNNAWVKIGDTQIDLSGYMTTAAFNIAIADYYDKSAIDTMIANYYTKTQVDAMVDAKQDELMFDNVPTAGSDNPVKSGGIKTALDAKQNTLTFDSAPTASSSNPVTSDGIKDAIDDTATDIYEVMGKNGAKNLLPFDLNELKRLNTSGTWNGTSYTNNGVTFAINSDNTISTSGTSSARFGFTIYLDYDARNMIMSGCPQGGARATYSLQYSNYSDQSFADIGNGYTIPSAINTGTWRVVIWIEAGAVLDNLIFKPMLRLASDIDPTYQPYAMTNQQMTSKLIGLADNVNKNGSKNLLRITKATSTVYGVSFTVYDDGHIRVSGTANNPSDTGCNFVFSYVNTEHEIPKGRYTLSCDGLPHSNTFQCVIDAADSAYQYVKRIAYIASASLTTFDVDYSDYACFYAFLHVGNGTTVNNVDVYPMLRLASDPDDTHVPFAMTNRELTENCIKKTLDNSIVSSTLGTYSTGNTKIVKYGNQLQFKIILNLASGSSVTANTWTTLFTVDGYVLQEPMLMMAVANDIKFGVASIEKATNSFIAKVKFSEAVTSGFIMVFGTVVLA